MKKLEPALTFISLGNGKFKTERNVRFIDLDNINKYNKRQIIEILASVNIYIGSKCKKKELIDYLMRNETALNIIKAENRNWKLQQIFFS